ncbi:acyl-CoA thioesterase [Rosistilla oblonga]|uniref:acyl-CoA thioesterase n=1 Tax=Rosistilla oblonga TaxID=2527990 RepID=UPI003A974DD5
MSSTEFQRPTALQDFPLVVRIPIQWGDLDAYGHVNNVVYMKWFEHVRCLYGERVGVEVVSRDSGTGAIVASVQCKYLRQLNFPGDVAVGVRVCRVSIGSVSLECLIVDEATGVPAAQATCDVVLYNFAQQKPVPVPDAIREAVEKLEGKSFPV